MEFMNAHWDFVVLLLTMIVGGMRISTTNTERIRTMERDIKAIKEDKRELFERTRFMITSQDFTTHLDKKIQQVEDRHGKSELLLRLQEEKLMKEIREMRTDVTDIRMRCAGCNTRAVDRIN